jgi:hypothetical protein
MPDYKFVVFSNPAPGREDEYNDWYDGVHIGDVVAVPGFTSAKRFRLVPGREEMPDHRYLAIYDISSDDIDATRGDLMARAGDGRMPISEALGEVRTFLFEAMPDKAR